MKLRSWIIIACISFASPRSRAAIDPQRIDDSIDLAKSYLYSQQQNDNWESAEQAYANQPTGLTAMAVYALLSSGESNHDPHIAKAIEYMLKTPGKGAFALGMRCQVWLLLPQTPEIKRAMYGDASVLRSSVITEGPGRGFYPYSPEGRGYSHSRGQFAVLGLWAASQNGVEVPDAYWQMVEKAWIACQDPSGGWAYQNQPSERYPLVPDMTAAGVATLFITQDFLHADDATIPHGNIVNPHIDSGIKWLIDNIDKVASDDKTTREYPYSTVYTLERVGVASGLRYFGGVNWYDKCADFLLQKQRSDGDWPAELHSNVFSTSCAMLFLARGRAPIAMSKLDYSVAGAAKPATWNQRPRDVANLSRFIGKQLEREMNWQVVNLQTAVEDWHDSPILYISGGDPLMLDAAAKEKLKQFVEEGGLILGNPDGDSRGFAVTFRKLGQELFPQYEFRELPADHVIFTNEQFHRVNWERKISVLGLSNGVRELMLIPPIDLARSWQTQSLAAHEEQWQIASDIFLYSNDSASLRKRGQTYLVQRDEKITATSTLKIARLKYAGNWDPEPAGWRRLANILHNKQKVDLQIEPVNLADGSLDGVKIAHLTGTQKFTLDDGQRQTLKNFVDGGGTLVIDAAGGSEDFATAMEKELATIFPDKQLMPIAASDVMFAAGGEAMKSFAYRPFAAQALSGSLKNEPRLQGMQFGNRWGVIFSREDLSAGLVGEPMDGIVGYAPATASEIMSRILLYAGAGK